jgi:hypothetical protein
MQSANTNGYTKRPTKIRPKPREANHLPTDGKELGRQKKEDGAVFLSVREGNLTHLSMIWLMRKGIEWGVEVW